MECTPRLVSRLYNKFLRFVALPFRSEHSFSTQPPHFHSFGVPGTSPPPISPSEMKPVKNEPSGLSSAPPSPHDWRGARSNGRQPEPEPAFDPADVVSDLSSFVSDVLGRSAGSAIVYRLFPNSSISYRQKARRYPHQRQSQSRPCPASRLIRPQYGIRSRKRLSDVCLNGCCIFGRTTSPPNSPKLPNPPLAKPRP